MSIFHPWWLGKHLNIVYCAAACSLTKTSACDSPLTHSCNESSSPAGLKSHSLLLHVPLAQHSHFQPIIPQNQLWHRMIPLHVGFSFYLNGIILWGVTQCCGLVIPNQRNCDLIKKYINYQAHKVWRRCEHVHWRYNNFPFHGESSILDATDTPSLKNSPFVQLLINSWIRLDSKNRSD